MNWNEYSLEIYVRRYDWKTLGPKDITNFYHTASLRYATIKYFNFMVQVMLVILTNYVDWQLVEWSLQF